MLRHTEIFGGVSRDLHGGGGGSSLGTSMERSSTESRSSPQTFSKRCLTGTTSTEQARDAQTGQRGEGEARGAGWCEGVGGGAEVVAHGAGTTKVTSSLQVRPYLEASRAESARGEASVWRGRRATRWWTWGPGPRERRW
jgi:hypothetical protein